MKVGQNLEFFTNRSISENCTLEKSPLSTEAIIFDKEDLIYRHREFSRDSFELYIEVLSRIFWNSIDPSFCDLKFKIFFFHFLPFFDRVRGRKWTHMCNRGH